MPTVWEEDEADIHREEIRIEVIWEKVSNFHLKSKWNFKNC